MIEPITAAAPRRTRRHVHEIDVVRVLTFAAVIAVHVIGHVNGQSVSANALVMLLHFTREAFFILTGFVLAHQYFARSYRVRTFWARRFLTVGTPYVVWTLIYTGMHWYIVGFHGSAGHWLRQFGTYLIYGQAWYHLYFLLVSMQVYLLYPLIAALLHATRRHHVALLAVSAAVEIATMWWVRFDPPRGGVLGALVHRDDILVLSYQFYVLFGAVVAIHLDEVAAWIRRRPWAVAGALVASGALVIAWYLRQVHDGLRPTRAAAVLQPVMVPWAVAIVAALFGLGIWWSVRRRHGGVTERFFTTGSDRSFGIYLVHPAILWVILRNEAGWSLAGLPRFWLTLVVYLLTVLGSVAVIEVARRSPVSLALTGRSRPKPEPVVAGPVRKERHAIHHARPAVPRGKAPHGRFDHDDRHRTADAAVRGYGE